MILSLKRLSFLVVIFLIFSCKKELNLVKGKLYTKPNQRAFFENDENYCFQIDNNKNLTNEIIEKFKNYRFKTQFKKGVIDLLFYKKVEEGILLLDMIQINNNEDEIKERNSSFSEKTKYLLVNDCVVQDKCVMVLVDKLSKSFEKYNKNLRAWSFNIINEKIEELNIEKERIECYDYIYEVSEYLPQFSVIKSDKTYMYSKPDINSKKITQTSEGRIRIIDTVKSLLNKGVNTYWVECLYVDRNKNESYEGYMLRNTISEKPVFIP